MKWFVCGCATVFFFSACEKKKTSTSDASSRYAIGGTVTGLLGQGLVLLDNGGDADTVTSDGSFAFASKLPDANAYAVTVGAQPSAPSQTCTVDNGSGTVAGAAVGNVAVACVTNTFTIGGTVTGLAAGDSLVLEDNGGDDLTITASGAFTFATALSDGGNFDVEVTTQPTGATTQLCTASNNTGALSGANVTSVQIACVSYYSVGGTISNLLGVGLVVQNNGGEELEIGSGGSFSFMLPLASGAAYAVTVVAEPAYDAGTPGTHNQTCVVTNGTGQVGSADVSVAITCYTNTVSPLYKSNGANWLDYVNNDAAGPFNTAAFAALDTACAEGSATDYHSCLHGGEYRVVTLPGVTSCAGISASDALGAFVWQCIAPDSGSALPTSVRIASWRLASAMGLSDLIDFATPAWRSNTITVDDGNGDQILQSDPSTWWTNTIAALPAAGGTLAATANEIFVVAADLAVTATVKFGSPKQAIVVGRGSVLSAAGQDNVVSVGDDFCWLEGTLSGAGGLSATVFANTVEFLVANNLTIVSSPHNGILTSNLANSLFTNLGVGSFDGANTGSYALNLSSGRNNRIEHALLSGGVISGSNSSVMGDNDTNDIYYDLRLFDASGGGLDNSSGSDTIIVGLDTDSLGGTALSFYDAAGEWFADLTLVNSAGNAPSFSTVSSSTIANLAVGNCSGPSFSGGSSNLLANFASVGNSIVLAASTASTVALAGIIAVDNADNCDINSSTDCTESGAVSVTDGQSFAGTFVGEAGSDSVNLDGGIEAANLITDWLAFENDFRGWGGDDTDGGTKSATAFPSATLQDACTGTSSCQVWDSSLLSTDAVLRNVLTPPADGNATATQVWFTSNPSTPCASILGATGDYTTCTSTYLRNAVEIFGDGIGNDNGLCESGETCLFTPNIGAYQGQGALVCLDGSAPPCAVTIGSGGTLTNITLMKYSVNGT